MKKLEFQLTQSKLISITNLTNEPLNIEWKYQWYACRGKNCDKSDNTFYAIRNANGDNIIGEWVADTQVEFEFFETTNYTYPSFYIYVLIDKNDDESDICVYSVEVESIDGRTPVFLLDLSALDCLNVVNQTNDIEITGKLNIRFAPKLKQIKFDILSPNNIEFLGDNKLSTNISLIKINTNNDTVFYEFKFNINILTYGKGSISYSFVTQSGSLLNAQGVYNFYIIPNLQQLLNPTTTLPWSCSNVGNQTNNAPTTFDTNQTITTLLNLNLFEGFLDRFVFIYSVAEVTTPNFCNTNNLDSITSYREVTRANGNQMNGVSHTFTATLTPPQLNNLPRPFTYAVRLEVRRTDINCSHIANLRGWTVTNANVVCPTTIPYQTLQTF